jgi:hypothetical protein
LCVYQSMTLSRCRHTHISEYTLETSKGNSRYWSNRGCTPKCASPTVVRSSFPVVFVLHSSTVTSNTKFVTSTAWLMVKYQRKWCPDSIFT